MPVHVAVRRALDLLDHTDRYKLMFVAAAQVALSGLDLIGILLLGLVGGLAIASVQGQPPPGPVENLVELIGLQGLSDEGILLAFTGAAAIMFFAKSVLSSLVLRRVFLFLAARQASVSSRLAQDLLSRPLTFLLRRSSHETAHALVQGASAATLVILGQSIVLISETSLLLIIGMALLFVNPVVAAGAIAFFASVAVLLHFALGRWAASSGRAMSQADIASLSAIQEAISAYREIVVGNRRSHYTDRIQSLRGQAARVAANMQTVSLLPKYVFEVALVVGGFVLAAILFATQETAAAVGTFTLFLAAATRVMPSILRLQGATLTLKNAAGIAGTTFSLAADLEGDGEPPKDPDTYPTGESPAKKLGDDFLPTVDVHQLSYSYPGGERRAVNDISLFVPAGSSLALVGSSGAGKSTLVDLILGVLEPCHGSVRIAGMPPRDAVSRWSGGIAYVPQEVMIANASLRENVALGFPSSHIDDSLVWEALRRAHVSTLFLEERDGLDTVLGERGVRLSGGQRQRVGIARALYTRPSLIVLDEATSALDAETESAVRKTLMELEGQVTTVVIAHRLSTIRHADQVAYLQEGRALAVGTFEEVVQSVPAFRAQAELMGLR